MNFRKEDQLALDQVETMRYKEKLNFNECLIEDNDDKRKFDKIFKDHIDVFINNLDAKGILFYGFTLNFSNCIDDEKTAWQMIHFRVEEFLTNIKNLIEMLEFVYLSIECHGERQEQREQLLLPGKINGDQINNKNFNKFDKILDISIEEKKSMKGLPHLHGIIGVRSLLGKNNELLHAIKRNILYSEMYDDIIIKDLKTFKQIKGYWNYVIKEKNYKFHRFVHYSKFLNQYYGRFYELQIKYSFNDDSITRLYGGGYIDYAMHNDINNLCCKNPSSKQVLIKLLNLYMYENKIYIYNNDLYIKEEKSKFSWKLISNLLKLKDNIFEILNSLKQKFDQQLNNLNINDLIINNIDDVYEKILKQNKYLLNINFNKSIIEFKNGLYFFDYDYFLNYNNKNLNKLSINCYKYFNKNYNYCAKNKPNKWLELLKSNFENEQQIEEFCVNLGTYFHSRILIDTNKKTLCVVGQLNTGKTALIANILTETIGEQNIGYISNTGGNFAFEQIEDKQLIICDEIKYTNSNRSDLLKVLYNESVLLNKKGIFINKASIIFIFNPETNNKMLEDQTFINRLLIYTFTNQIMNFNKEIKEILEKELPQIMIYCNKLFFKKYKVNLEMKKYKKNIIKNYK